MTNYKQNTTDISGNLVYKPIKLSGNDANDVKKISQLMLDVMKHQKRLWRKEINDWQYARQARYNRQMPRNFPLQEVYEDVLLDGQLTGITENRTFRTTNKDYIFVDKEGRKDDACTTYIKEKTWFEEFIRNTHESVYFGTQLLFIKEVNKGEIVKIERVERGAVVPELQLLVTEYQANKGLDYSLYPNYLIEVQMYDPIGLLEKATPYTILKRHSWGSWDEFEELFGVPIRIAKIASQSEQVKNEVAGWLEEMGSAPYGVFPLGTEVEIKENSKGDAFNVFYQKIKAIQEELSILILHQTMTTQNGSSQAQGNVHQNTMNEVLFADEKRMLSILNDQLIPVMRAHGYAIPEGYKIAINQTKDPNIQIDIDARLMQYGVVMKQSYLEEIYGCEIESMPTAETKIKEKENPKKP